MLAAALCFAAGDLIARRWQPPALLATSCGVVLLLAIVTPSAVAAHRSSPGARAVGCGRLHMCADSIANLPAIGTHQAMQTD